MKTALVSVLMFCSLGAFAAEPLNCVNPGGSCDGSVPCCDSHNNACVRGRCTPGPGFFMMGETGGTCYSGLNCAGAVVAPNVSPADCLFSGGFSWDDGSGCENLN